MHRSNGRLAASGRAWVLAALLAASTPYAQELAYLPGDQPDRIVLTPSSDPARSQTVNWRTSTAVMQAEAEIAVATGAPAFAPERVQGAMRRLYLPDRDSAHHRVTFTGLQPDTAYVYRVAGLDVWSEWFQFRTAADTFQPHSIIYLGDAQNAIRTRFARTLRQALLATSDARLVLHAGDLIDRAGVTDALWGEWFAAGDWIHASIPALPAAGNHEYDEQAAPVQLSPHWPAQFSVPGDGPEALAATVYTVLFQGVRYLVLDSTAAVHDENMARLQADWMQAVLADDDALWTVALFHHPVFSVSHGHASPNLDRHWRPVFEAAPVDLVLQGHDHVYGRRGTPGGEPSEGRAGIPLYVVSVAGAKMNLAAVDGHAYDVVAEDVQLFQTVQFAADHLRLDARAADGTLHDTVVIRRDADGSKWLELPEASPAVLSSCANPYSTPAYRDDGGRSRPGRCREGLR